MISCLKTFAIIALLAGCGLLPPKQIHFYEGPKKPISELAVLAESNANRGTANNYGTHLTHINGKRISPPAGGRYVDAIYLLPGEYEMTFSYFSPSFNRRSMASAKGTATVRVEASHRYIPYAKLDRERNKSVFYLLDKGEKYPVECLRTSPYYERTHNCD